MSYDLAVWHEPAGIAADQAARKYTRLITEEPGTDPTHPRVAAFYRELTARYPELDGLPDDDSSPWSVRLTVTSAAVVMCLVWSRADEVGPQVRSLADRHGLVVFDPQNESVHHPEAMRTKPTLVLSTCGGSQADNPDPETIKRTLRTLSLGNWFAVLERGDTYVQVGFGENAGTRPGWYALERRDGSADKHFRAEVADLDEIIAAFTGFAGHDGAWPQRFSWRKVVL
ncbi:hypothetical protein [Amycolatopsis sp. YIM 10]|uniref:hypothetical protein n=1 Tax=Amycolatopsis sp. YIM 10 TaxID=2653857 RepID=UPI00128FD646|nr:hypothetical protein [Amycolatopsis sp. YIM 10]QFU88364.1 hypothetical protein YIM_15915 [Amycolatopsis sp. YIM 10]